LLLALLTFAGCTSETGNDEITEKETSYSVSYFYSYAEETDYASQEIREKLDSFGEIKSVDPAAPFTEIHTEIPQADNNAKGTDPVAIILSELELSDYRSCEMEDPETDLSTSGAYRIVAGMPTDELIKVYIDSAGQIKQYETVNLRKYDNLALDEQLLERKCGTFKNQIQQTLGASVFEFMSPTKVQGTSNCVLFTDTQGNVVISTDVALKDEGNPAQSIIKVHLYAVLTPLY